MAKRGHNVLVLVESKKGVPKQSKIEGFSVVSLGSSIPVIGLVLVVLEGLVRLLVRKNGTEVVHVNYFIYYSLSAYLFNIITARPYVISCRGSDIMFVRRNALWKSIQRMVLSRAALVTVVSEEIRGILESEYNVPRRKISVIPNGIDKAEIEEVLSLAEAKDPSGIVYLGSFRPVKDPLTALRAFQRVHRDYPRSKLTMVGDGPLRAPLERYIINVGLSGAVTLTGNVNHRRALLELAQSGIFLMSSLSEGFPNALLEAMALGKTVVATAVGGVTDLVDGGHNGLLAPPRSPERMAEALDQVLADRNLALRLGDQARETSKSYTWGNITTRYLDIYENITFPRHCSP